MTTLSPANALAALALVASVGCRKAQAPPPATVPVTVARAERRAVPFELAANGSVEPLQTVALLPQVSGIRIAFTEGQEVEKAGPLPDRPAAIPGRAGAGAGGAGSRPGAGRQRRAGRETLRVAIRKGVRDGTAVRAGPHHCGSRRRHAGRQPGGGRSGEAQPPVRHHPGADQWADRQPQGPPGKPGADHRHGSSGDDQPDPPDPGPFRRPGVESRSDPIP